MNEKPYLPLTVDEGNYRAGRSLSAAEQHAQNLALLQTGGDLTAARRLIGRHPQQEVFNETYRVRSSKEKNKAKAAKAARKASRRKK